MSDVVITRDVLLSQVVEMLGHGQSLRIERGYPFRGARRTLTEWPGDGGLPHNAAIEIGSREIADPSVPPLLAEVVGFLKAKLAEHKANLAAPGAGARS